MNNTEEAIELSKIDEIKVLSSNKYISNQWEGQPDKYSTSIEMLIRGNVVIFKLSDDAGSGFPVFLKLMKDPEMRYLISEISSLNSGFMISKDTTIKRLKQCGKRDPDSVILALQSAFGMIDISEYTPMSSELIDAVGESYCDFKEQGIGFNSYLKMIKCDNVLRPLSVEYMSTKTASILNPITAYLDHMGVLYNVIDKARMLKLKGL